jgi:protein-S-isoprenylcysteine O-methyltransferase Ste14
VSAANDIRDIVFRYRSYTPIPFLLAMVVFAEPTGLSLIVGGVMVLGGEGLRFWGVSIVGAETRTTGSVGGTYLVTTGPYAFVRNPLYVGNILIYLGVGVMSMALFPWLHLVAAGWFYLQYSLIVNREEEYLRDRFGEAYAAYCSAVPRFVPRWKPYRSASPTPKHFSPSEGFLSERRTLQAIVLVTVLVLVRFGMREWW